MPFSKGVSIQDHMVLRSAFRALTKQNPYIRRSIEIKKWRFLVPSVIIVIHYKVLK